MVAGLLAPQAAVAAGGGSAVVDTEITPVDYATGDTQLDASFGAHGNRLAYRVSFSCAVETCVDLTVQLSPSQPDPYGLAAQAPSYVAEKSLLTFESWTAPAGIAGATIEGTDATGKIARLGTVPAGTSGSFLVVYSMPPTGGYTAIRPMQFYPSGFQILNSATIDAATAQETVTREAAAVTWTSELPSPSLGHSTPATVRPDTPVSYQVYMSSGAMTQRDAGSIAGTSQFGAAGDYIVTETLAPEAEYVSSSDGGIYDADAHTVTWALGSEDSPAYNAAGGFGKQTGAYWTPRGPYHPRSVTVTYPASAFAGADANGCNFEATVTNFVDAEVGYLDEPRTRKQATRASSSHLVSCYDPFARASSLKDSTNNGTDAGRRVVIVPDEGQPATVYSWRVTASNGGNVPAVAVIEDTSLGQADTKVDRVTLSAGAGSIDYTLNTGETGTAATPFAAPAGTWITAATVTTGVIQPVNVRPSDNRNASVVVDFRYSIASGAPVGETRTNTATTTVSYPDNPELAPIVTPPASRTIIFKAPSVIVPQPRFTAQIPTRATVEGGGNATPGRNVTFTVSGSTANLPADAAITPQYVFIAPTGWVITPGSASFPAGSVPDGVTFTEATRTIAGEERQVVVASWSDTVSFGINTTLPVMSVVAQPTYAVVAGTTSTASAWIGESGHRYNADNASFVAPVINTDDVAGDGNTDQVFSTATENILVSAADGVTVTKQICRVDSSAADGCDWISDPDVEVPVSTTATDIRYRIIVQNTGNTRIGDIVAYDVLPYLNDVGTSQGASTSPRGSTFAETLGSVENVSPNMTLDFSASTNPVRDEVYPDAPGAIDDWSSEPVGKQAIRARVDGTLAPGETVSFEYRANVASDSPADAVACNSVAVDTDKTLPAEPRAVCASTKEADLTVSVPDHLPLQDGRDGTVPFVISNLGGSQSAPATVTLDVPAGLTVTSLTPAGWTCSAAGGSTAPVDGPVTLECQPVDADGAPSTIALDSPLALDLAVRPSGVTAQVCVGASVSGPFNDPVLSNNDALACSTVTPTGTGLILDKSDGVDSAKAGDLLTYTITVANGLVGETVDGGIVTDVLPAEVEFVSATAGGTAEGQVVTWNLASLAPSGDPSAGGDQADGGEGSTTEVSVTVRVLRNNADTIRNTADIAAPDPSDAASELTGTDTDVNTVAHLTLTKTADAPAHPRVGDTISYTVVVTNDGTADYSADAPATMTDDLSGALDDASFNDDATASAGADPVFNTPTLTWSGDLAAGDSVTIRYSVTVIANGDGHVTNTACIPELQAAAGENACATVTTELPKLSITKTAEPVTVPAIGDSVTYTVTLTNDGLSDYSTDAPATMTDDLTGVLDDASYNGDASASTGEAPRYVDGLLRWSGELAAGGSVTITYSVTYQGSGDHELVNIACVPRDEVTAGRSACVTNTVGAAFIVAGKTADPASETTVAAGDEIEYTLTFQNLGTADGSLDTVDDASRVLDDAVIVTAPVSSDPRVTVGSGVGGIYPITGTVEQGETVTITYTVRVLPYAEGGDHQLTNFVGTVPESGTCAPGSGSCTSHPVSHLSVTKVADAGSETTTGDVVQYTVTVTNDGAAPFTADTPAVATDDLTGVIDDASYRGDVTATRGVVSITEGQLVWSGPLEAGASATITYSVEVNNGGDHTLVNTASAPNRGDETIVATVTTPLSDIHINKTADPTSGSVSTGDVINYAIEFRNDGAAPGAIDARDATGDVLDDAQIIDEPTTSADSLALSPITAEGFAITGAIAPGETVVVTYSVRVLPFAERGDSRIVNHVLSDGADSSEPGAGCEPAAEGTEASCTEHTIAHASVTKNSSVTANLAEGDVVSYSVEVTNDGTADFTPEAPAEMLDELVDVLDDATWIGDASSSDGTAVRLEGTELRWSGALPAGESVVITYSVLVTGAGDRTLHNTASVGNAGEAERISADTVALISDITAEKTADVSNAATVKSGQQVRYTLTFQNAGPGTGDVAYSDDLADVLDDATVTDGPNASGSVQSSILDGVIQVTGDLAPGATASVQYTVTVKSFEEQGDHRLLNTLTQIGVTAPDECTSPSRDGDPQTCTFNPISAEQLASTGINGITLLLAGGGVLVVLGGFVLILRRRARAVEPE
ncbi:hypothetical protein ACQ3HE_18990 [Plantibacter auratus]|uniref:DUF7927 domain-containing protein n=1 Tax=Plantibacter auratus TaxID=272914 RepID=UPI003D341C6D